MFSEAECRVKWNSCSSEILKRKFGFLQGGMLSPKLFTEFYRIYPNHSIKVRVRFPVVDKLSPVAILSIISCLHDLTWVLSHIAFKVFDCQILPILEYASGI